MDIEIENPPKARNDNSILFLALKESHESYELKYDNTERKKIIMPRNQIFKNSIQLFLNFTNELVLIAIPFLIAVKACFTEGENRDFNDMTRLR